MNSTTLALAVLLAPTLLLGGVASLLRGEIWLQPSWQYLFRYSALVALVAYCVFSVHFGVEYVYSLNEVTADFRKFLVMYLLAGLAFGAAIFPQALSHVVQPIVSFELYEYEWAVALYGWVGIMVLALIIGV